MPASIARREKGEFYFAKVERKGQPTAKLLAALLPEVFPQFPWPKAMRWGAGKLRWVRPPHSILCLFDGKVVPVAFGAVQASDLTVGHRFLAPKPFKVKGFGDYRERLRGAYVMLDREERREAIAADATLIAKNEGLSLKRGRRPARGSRRPRRMAGRPARRHRPEIHGAAT